jgi:uncharacterized membrane protein
MTVTPKLKAPKLGNIYLRTLPSLAVAAIVATLLPSWMAWATRILCIWDAGMICFLGQTAWVILPATPKTMRRYAQQENVGRLAILSLATATACASLFAIGFILHDKGLSGQVLFLHLTLSVVTIIGSWLLVHTIFALHYAYAYYGNHATHPDQKAGGVEFPGEAEPDYWDFLYFSFVIGMTSQVSDVAITSRNIRRLALLHGILSFFFNTSIVAMTINIVAGLI